jgi:hypothetical protein
LNHWSWLTRCMRSARHAAFSALLGGAHAGARSGVAAAFPGIDEGIG